MRAISDDLRAAQRAAGVAWTVTGQHAPRGASGRARLWTDQGLTAIWESGARPYAGHRLTGSVAHAADGNYIHVVRAEGAGRIGVRRVAGFAAASAVGVTDVATLAAPYTGELSTVGVLAYGNEVRIVYGDGVKVRWIGSSDGGVTWGAPADLYNGGGSYVRYSNFALTCRGTALSGYKWTVVYSAWTAGGEVRLRGAHDVGAGWVNWGVHGSTVDWQVAGCGRTEDQLRVYLFGQNYGWSSLAVGQMTLSGGAFVAWWTDLQIMDRAGVAGEVSYGMVRMANDAESEWCLLQEGRAGQWVWVLSGVRHSGGEYVIDEPALLVDMDAAAAGDEDVLMLAGDVIAGGEHYIPVAVLEYYDDYGETGSGVEVLEYEYSQRMGEGGRLRCKVREGEYPVEEGDLLTLRRTATATEAGGTVLTGGDVRAFVVWSVWRERGGLLAVEAGDGPGVMARHVLRRQRVLRAGDRTREGDVKALISWSGVSVDGVAFDGQGYVSAGFVARPGYSAWVALQRYIVDKGCLARPGQMEDPDEVFSSRVSVAVVQTAEEPYSGAADVEFVEYGTTAGAGQHVAGAWERRLGTDQKVYVALGEDDAWHVRLSDSEFRGVRRLPVVRVDRGRSGAALAAVTGGERRRDMVRDVRARLRCSAHAGLELYDLVALDGENYRVVAIRETWQGGRLVQELELG